MSDDLDLRTDPGDARLEAILRSMSEGDLDLETPPPSVWAGIEAAVAATSPVVVSLDARRRRRTVFLAAAVAAAFVVVAGLAVVLTDPDDGPVAVAQATLVFDEGFDPAGADARAAAALLEDGDRSLVRFDEASLPVPGAGDDLEVWLIGFEGDEIGIIQPLGLVENIDDPGTFEIPAAFDRTVYDSVAVDISIEPRDGIETHSGRSIIRGPLQQA